MKKPTNSSDIITKLVTLVFSDSLTHTLSFQRVSAVCILSVIAEGQIKMTGSNNLNFKLKRCQQPARGNVITTSLINYCFCVYTHKIKTSKKLVQQPLQTHLFLDQHKGTGKVCTS